MQTAFARNLINKVRNKLVSRNMTNSATDQVDPNKLRALLTQRFFYAPSFQLYGGVAGLYDYGPPGCALQANILSLWRNHFVLEEDMLEVDCTNLTPYEVLKTSGHVDRFADYMVSDVKSGEIFRADHLIKAVLKQRLEDDESLRSKGVKKGDKVPKNLKGEVLDDGIRDEYTLILEKLDDYDGQGFWKLIQNFKITNPATGNAVTEPTLFNLMFQTDIGPTGQVKGFLRPETAQGHFLNFKRLLEFNAGKMPFASASIGKSFRNEISPRSGLLRVREFTMAEIEHYVDPGDKSHPRFDEVGNVEVTLYPAERQLEGSGTICLTIGEAVEKKIINNQTLGYFVARINLFLLKIGIKFTKLRFRQHLKNEMAHYACDCWDAEIQSSFGWVECVGCADRSAYDLTVHSKRTKESLVAQEFLSEPIERTRWVIEVNRKVLGPKFKANAKHVVGYIDSLLEDDCTAPPAKPNEQLWDQKKLPALKEGLDANGAVTITGTDGKQYELTADMVSIFEKTEKISTRDFVPNVIEPSFGIGRIFYSLLEHTYYIREGDEQRAVFRFKPCVAPIKCLVAPLSSNKEFRAKVREVVSLLRSNGISSRVDDSSNSIGRRYARNDELGTPFGVTIDFDTLKDDTVTLRERDSTTQIRGDIKQIVSTITSLIEEKVYWADVLAKHGEYSSTLGSTPVPKTN